MSALSDLDIRILNLLQRDATLSMTEIANQVGSSSATCWRRVKNLEESGILGKTVRLIQPVDVGCSIEAFCQVRMKAQDATARDVFERAMRMERSITEVYSTSGEWDYLLHLVVKDITQLEETLMQHVLNHECVAGTATTFVLRRIKNTTEIPVG